MSFRTRLFTGFGTSIALMIVLIIAFTVIFHEQNQRMGELVEDRYAKIRIIHLVWNEIGSIGWEMNGLVFNESPVLDSNSIQYIRSANRTIKERLNSLQLSIANEEGFNLLNEIVTSYGVYTDQVEQVIEAYQSGERSMTPLLSEAERQRNRTLLAISDFVELQEREMDRLQADSNQAYLDSLYVMIPFSVCLIAAGALFAFWFAHGIARSLNRVKDVMTSVEFGSAQLPRIAVQTRDEIGEIASAFNAMAAALETHERNHREYEEAIRTENELKSQLAELSSLAQGILDPEALARQYVCKLAPIAGAVYGALYARETNADGDLLVKHASYADTEPAGGAGSPGSRRFRMGEGLIGQCAAQNERIELERVPDDYFHIASGLGSARPTSVLIVPVAFEDEVMAVLELAAFEPFMPEHKALITQAAGQLGITLNRIAKHMQIQALLHETQTYNEELQTQSEELQTQQEELRAMNEELQMQNHVSEQKTKELEDIRRELEEQARQIELGSRYKSEFLSNMSHELRTPLNSLLILAKMLTDNTEGNLSPRQTEFARTIYASGSDLLQMINDILDLSKIESGKMDIQIEEIAIDSLLAFAERRFRPTAVDKQIEFVLSTDDSLPPSIRSDELRLTQILSNLLSNAFKFTDRGRIRLHIRPVTDKRSGRGDGPMIAFSVSDTGIGIAPDKQQLIFEAFNQADGTTSRKYGGTGLGLSICKDLAQLLGGFIEVISEEGKGSNFTLYVPAGDPQRALPAPGEQQAQAEAAAGADGGTGLQPRVFDGALKEQAAPSLPNRDLEGVKVMIADDDMRNVFAIASILEEAGMEVVFAENGREAIDKLADHADIELVLMDIMMPEMDGYEAIRRIRAMPQHQSLPIIALTAKAMKQDRQQCIDAGASDYISKPVSIEHLFSLMKVWLFK